MVNRLRSVPPAAWVAAAVVVGLVFLMWDQYRRDDDDQSWTDVDQPPLVAQFPVMLPETGAAHGSGRPMDCCVGFRSRRHDPVLECGFDGVGLGASAAVTIGGRCG